MIENSVGRFVLASVLCVLLVLPLAEARSQQSGQASAIPTPVVAVIDFKRAVEESAAGKSILLQINQRHAQIQKEIAKDTAELEAQKQQLEQQQAILAPEAFKQRRREFQVRVQQYRRDIQTAQKRLDLMMAQSILKIEAKLAEVLRTLAQELGANLVVDAGPGRGSILFSDSQLVITGLAIDRLNSVLPDVTVVEPVVKQRPQQEAPRLQAPKVQ